MAFVPGFRLTERIYESDNSLLIRAVRDSDGLPVVIKILKNDFPTREELARYRREFEIIGELEAPGVIRAYDLRRHEKTLLMVLEDFGAMSLGQLLQERAITVDEFLDAAIQITRALELIHRANIIHKDITPHNIVMNPATGEVKIIDFGIATRFSREKPAMRSPEMLEGTLPYMSPEQTGRMNRSLDSRSDFYALGATFYEMLTGARPFDADDKLELVHCHIAREPIPPHRRSPDVPLALSKIVSKLMAKKAEDRYQSAAGLLADLEAMRHGAHAERFEPGLRDQSDRFHIPERLYGRDDEVARLLETFERTRHGPAELMLVSGYSGVGKSALVHETHKPITRARGYFVSGKFDQFQRNTPYSGLASALRDLVRQILTESEERLAAWRRDLDDALGPNAQAIIDLVPELELIIGPQPDVPELGGAEAKNRFHRVVGQFLRALASRDSPIVAFLDDLQWADTATLNLLRSLFAEGDLERVLLIGAYRDNEVDAMHPLRQTLKEIAAAGGRMESVTLRPLGLPDVARLLSDTLKADAAELTGFARLVVQKTQGNPLFVRQFLLDLHREGLIFQMPATATDRARWTWDLSAIREAGITDNVVDLLLRRMRLLTPETQEALRIASCIGNRFDIDTLALILKTTAKEAFDRLRPALDEELIRPGSELTASEVEDLLSPLVVHEFVFQHDRVQQAAYSLLDEDGRRAVHLTIGRRLLDTLSPEALHERLFEVVDHLNFGIELIGTEEERLSAAALNLAAARRASDSTAYATALTLARTAQGLLGAEGWRDAYELTRDAFRLRAELEYLNANYEICSEVVAETLENVRTDLERAEVYFTRIAQHTMLAQFPEAVEAGFRALSLVGVSMPRENLQEAGQQAIGEAAQMLAGRDPASLLDLPLVDSPEMGLAQSSLRHLTIAAFLANQELWPLVVGTSVKLSLEHGNAPESALSYANYGLILGAFMGRFRDGAAFGDLALRLCDSFEGRAPNATVRLVVGSELLPWVAHVDEAIPVIDQGIQEGSTPARSSGSATSPCIASCSGPSRARGWRTCSKGWSSGWSSTSARRTSGPPPGSGPIGSSCPRWRGSRSPAPTSRGRRWTRRSSSRSARKASSRWRSASTRS